MSTFKEKRMCNVTIEHVDRMCDEARITFDELIDRFALPIDLTDYFLNNHRLSSEESNRITRHMLAVKRKLYVERGVYRVECMTNDVLGNYVGELINVYGLSDVSRVLGIEIKDLIAARESIGTMKEKRLDALMKALTVTRMEDVEVTTTGELSEVLGWLRKIYAESDDENLVTSVYASKMKISEIELREFVASGKATRTVLKNVASFVETLRTESDHRSAFGNALIVES